MMLPLRKGANRVGHTCSGSAEWEGLGSYEYCSRCHTPPRFCFLPPCDESRCYGSQRLLQARLLSRANSCQKFERSVVGRVVFPSAVFLFSSFFVVGFEWSSAAHEMIVALPTRRHENPALAFWREVSVISSTRPTRGTHVWRYSEAWFGVGENRQSVLSVGENRQSICLSIVFLWHILIVYLCVITGG